MKNQRNLAFLLTAIFPIMTTISAEARLGELLAECINRYGAPLETQGDTSAFAAPPFTLICKFEDHQCVAILYKKWKSEGDELLPDPFTLEEVNFIIKINGFEKPKELKDLGQEGRSVYDPTTDATAIWFGEEKSNLFVFIGEADVPSLEIPPQNLKGL